MAFSYFTPMTVDHTKVPSTQTDFPVLINVTDNRFKTVANGGHVQNSSGFDVRPYSDSLLTAALTFELERYNASTGEVIMWVKIASLSSTVNTIIYLAYGNPSLTTDGSSTATWSNNFKAVYHLKDGTTLNLNDSTSNAFTLTNTNTVTATAGKVDGAAAFVTASNQSLNKVSATGLDPGNAFTISAWVNGTTSFPNAYNTVVAFQNSGAYKIIYVKSVGTLAMYALAGGAGVNYDGTGSHTLSTNTWYLVHFTYDTTNGIIGYVNAGSDGTAAATGAPNATNTIYIGNQTLNAGLHWDGRIDEVRLATVVRSANWITTEFNNQNAPGTFMTTGAEVATLVIMDTSPGAFSVAGSAAQLLSRRLVNAATGAFLVTGTNVAMYKYGVSTSGRAVINFKNPSEHQISSNLLGTLTTTGLKTQQGQSSWPR